MSPERKLRALKAVKSAKLILDIISIEDLEMMEREALKEMVESYFDKSTLDIETKTD